MGGRARGVTGDLGTCVMGGWEGEAPPGGALGPRSGVYMCIDIMYNIIYVIVIALFFISLSLSLSLSMALFKSLAIWLQEWIFQMTYDL